MTELSEMNSADRKMRPMARGLLDYFPDALAEVSYVSFVGNEKHNPSQHLHWSKGKSDDHADCVIRHLVDRGKWDIVEISGVTYKVRHSAYAAWRALANLQIEIENERKQEENKKWSDLFIGNPVIDFSKIVTLEEIQG